MPPSPAAEPAQGLSAAAGFVNEKTLLSRKRAACEACKRASESRRVERNKFLDGYMYSTSGDVYVREAA